MFLSTVIKNKFPVSPICLMKVFFDPGDLKREIEHVDIDHLQTTLIVILGYDHSFSLYSPKGNQKEVYSPFVMPPWRWVEVLEYKQVGKPEDV